MPDDTALAVSLLGSRSPSWSTSISRSPPTWLKQSTDCRGKSAASKAFDGQVSMFQFSAMSAR